MSDFCDRDVLEAWTEMSPEIRVFLRLKTQIFSKKKEVSFLVTDLSDTELCIDSEAGHLVYKKIKHLIQLGYHVNLSFKGVRVNTTCFLNNAIGALYGVLTHDEIKKYLTVKDISGEDLYLLKRVVDNAKSFFIKQEQTQS